MSEPRPPRFSRRTAWDRSDNALSQELARARAAGRALVDLTESNPTRAGLGGADLVPLLGHTRGAAYAPAALGHASARAAVAGYYAERGLSIPSDRVCLSASTSEAYGWIFKLLCERGDEVLIPAPSYPLFSFLAALEDVTLVPYPLLREERFRTDLAALEARIGERTRAIVLVHPNNPTGSFVRRDEAAAIEDLARRHGLALIVDEVFGDYAHGALPADRLPSFAGDRAALTFVLSGLSKVTAMPQVKLGWIVTLGPEAIAAEAMGRLEVIADTYLSVSTPVQLALPEILAGRSDIQAAIRARVEANLAALDDAIVALGSDAPVRRLPVDGGWYATLEVPRTRDEDAWVELLVQEEGVIVHPGYFFDFAEEGYLVVSLLPEARLFREAIARVARRTAEG
ncbi:Cystathionine beta-lyase, type II [Minicystis rosea]|nr:Cystathionine beta-lyase, type II [Minicystis rosea]